MAQGRETRSFLIFIKEVLQAGCFDGQYIWFFPVTQLPVECLQHTIRGGSLSLSLSLFGVLYSMECHIFLLYSVSWLEFVLGMQKKYFFKQHIYVYYTRSMFQLEWTQNCEKPASWWIAQTSKANIGKK